MRKPATPHVPRHDRLKIAVTALVDERTVNGFFLGQCSDLSAHKIRLAIQTLNMVHLLKPGFKA